MIMATNTTLTATLRLLITANHILHHHSLVDAFGHISARSPLDPSTFYMASMLAPAVVTSPADLVQYHVSNGSAVDPDAPQGYRERFIHSEILRLFPSVGSVVHSHADEVLPYTIVEGVGVEPAFHMAGFLGTTTPPLFDIADHYSPSDHQDLLVSSPRLGAALASYFLPFSSSANDDDAAVGPGVAAAANATPAHVVVLQRGHGFTTLAPDVATAVYRAYYIAANARLQSAAVGLASSSSSMSSFSGGAGGGVKYLRAREREDGRKESWEWVRKAWGLWVREVRAVGAGAGLYENVLGWPEVQ